MSLKLHEQKPKQADFFNLCQNCPLCCCVGARPPITLKRRKLIENHLKATGWVIKHVFENGSNYTFPRETEGNTCVFLNKNTKKCQIHSTKPETCVAGPVTFDINVNTGKIEWFLKTEKICPLAAALYANKSEMQKHLESARRELLQLVHDLDAKALQAILKIEEPGTFKIGEEDLNPTVLAKLKPYS